MQGVGDTRNTRKICLEKLNDVDLLEDMKTSDDNIKLYLVGEHWTV